MDLYFDIVSGQRIVGMANPDTTDLTPATDIPVAKLGTTIPIRIRWLNGTVPCAAPNPAIKFALKPVGHYADTTFDLYTDTFTAPTPPTGGDAYGYYTGSLLIDSGALRALFPTATDGTSPDGVLLIAEVTAGTAWACLEVFQFGVYNNLIKGTESPAVVTPGIAYPSAASVATTVAYAVRDYAAESESAIDGSLAGKTANASTYNIFSAGDFSAGTGFVRNPSLWSNVDLTCFSPWNSTLGASEGGTLVTPKHVVLANHFSGSGGSFPMTAGSTTIKFVDKANTIYTRTITTLTQVGSSDLLIGTLDSDLPAAISPAPILPSGLPAGLFLAGFPLVTTNAGKRLLVAEMSSFATVSVRSATGTGRTSWTASPLSVAGDSGSPMFFLLGGRAVLWYAIHTPTTGEPVNAHIAAVNTILGAGYALTVAGVYPAFDPTALRNGDDASLNTLEVDGSLTLSSDSVVNVDADGAANAFLATDAGGHPQLLTLSPGQVPRLNAGGTALEGCNPGATVFPDADPHIVGAGYWSSGVFTRSAG